MNIKSCALEKKSPDNLLCDLKFNYMFIFVLYSLIKKVNYLVIYLYGLYY